MPFYNLSAGLPLPCSVQYDSCMQFLESVLTAPSFSSMKRDMAVFLGLSLGLLFVRLNAQEKKQEPDARDM